MSLKDITITSSINSSPTLSYGQKTYIPSTDYESFPIETVIGGNGGVMPDLNGDISSSNLFINITQSWSSSVITPLGVIDFIDNTQNEFINGQFSGSSVLISNGELSEDNPFLEANTIPVNYITTIYFDDKASPVGPGGPAPVITPQSNFLNPNTSPNPGEIYLSIVNRFPPGGGPASYKVEYLKIATIDSNGRNNTLSLQGLQSIYIQYTNGNIRKYIVNNITKYLNYYLFSVTRAAYDSIDSKRLDYSVSASNSSSIYCFGSSNAIIDYSTLTTDILNYLDTSSGIYTLGNTPNMQLLVTASVTASSLTSATVSGIFSLVEYPSLTPTSIKEQFTSVASPYNILITGSFTPIEGQSYVLLFTNTAAYSTASLDSIQFNITQSSTTFPVTGTQNLVNFSPYLSEDFFYNNWNALYSNADGLEYDRDFMKVDYDTGQSIPTNQEEILLGIAERAPVKPYNYALKAQTSPRYEGVRSQSPNFNLPATINGYGLLPNVDSTTTYFAYFTRIKTNNPILKDTSSPVIKYLIRDDGTTYNPATDDIAYYNIVYSFPQLSKAYATLLFNTTTTFNSTQSVLLSGESYTPILYSLKEYSGNVASWTGSLNFTNLVGGYDPNPNNFDFYQISDSGPTSLDKQLMLFSNWPSNLSPANVTQWFPLLTSTAGNFVISRLGASNGTVINTTSEINPYYHGTGSSAIYPYYSSYNGYGPNNGTWVQDIDTTPNPDPITGSYYEFTSVPQSSINIDCDVYYEFKAYGNYRTPFIQYPYQQFAALRLRIYLKRGSNAPTVLTYNDCVGMFGEGRCKVSLKGFTPLLNDKIFFTVENIGVGAITVNVFYINLGNGHAQFKITTNKDAGDVNNTPYFWTTGSANDTTITSSIELGAVLQGDYKQTDITASGFDPISLPSTIKVGDEFRFEYDETNVFKVVDTFLFSSGSGIACAVTFDRYVPTTPSLNIDHFTVRRKVKDYITGITLDNNLITQISGGFLFPEYPSKDLTTNLPKIITNLSEKNKI